MSNVKVSIKSPVGRIVMGSLYKANTTDAEGKPLVTKTGPNAGQGRIQYFFALAIPKGAEKAWWETSWGADILKIGQTAFPQAYQSADFAWKIIDGDSTAPGKLFKGKPGKPPADNEGFKGNWVLKLTNGFAPKVYRQEGAGFVQETTIDYVKPGHFVEVLFEVSGNDSMTSPGIYLNIGMVCFRAFGPEINFGPDVNEVGFGAAPLPAGASAAPLASTIPPPSTGIPSMGVPGLNPPQTGVPSVPAPGLIAGVPVVPNSQFLNRPAQPAASTVVPPPPATQTIPAGQSPSKMTAKAGSATREQFIAQGWTDANLIAEGYMLA